MKIPLEKEQDWFFLKILLFMKLILFVFCFNVAQASTLLYGQSINLSLKNESMESVLLKISKQAGYDLVYDAGILQKTSSTDLELKNVSIEDALNQVFVNRPFEYTIKKNTIVIRPVLIKSKLKSTNFPVQQRPITGKVTDDDGNPLFGVTVMIKGQPEIGTTTNGNGMYVLNIPKNVVLVFRYIGYLNQEISVENQSSIDVTLKLDQKGLEEIVIVGFGKQKKESLVSSIATIKGKELRMPTRSLSNNLAGQIPGLIAVQRSGEPGYDNAEFWIRGVSSFAGGTNPLVLVDGVPRNMNDIEPDEIETFTLLKDASATAIYGAEGANGVVLITSKRGRIQKTEISYRGEYSQLTPTRVPRFAKSFDYLSLYNEALRNEGKEAVFSEDVLAKYASGEDPDLYPSSNWWDLLMKDHTNNTRHTLNFRGGGEKMRFFASGAYFGENGYYKVNDEYNNNAGLKRYNLRSNIDIDISKTTLLRIDLSGQYLQANYPGFDATNIFERFARIPPHLFPAIYSDGTLANHPSLSSNKVNPYNQLVESGYRKEWRSGIQSRVDLDQKLDFLTSGLKIRGAVSYDANSIYGMSRMKVPESYFAEGRNVDGSLIFRKITNETSFGNPSEENSGDKNIYMESSLDYDRVFGRHTVGGMFLFYQKEKQLHDDALSFRKQAYIGRSTYSFDNRYSIEANFGISGSENFADGYRYGFFPAVGLAWNMTNEPYFPDKFKDIINSLKLRFSIGRTGNDNTGGTRFMYRPTFESAPGYYWGIGSTGSLNWQDGLVEGRFASPALSWEIEIKRNYGIDATLLGGKIDLQFDYFNNNRSDILLQRKTISEVAGFRESPWQNFGEVNNKGVDGSLNVNHKFGDVALSARGNVTFARNKIIEYDEIPQVHSWMNTTGTRLNGLSGLVLDRLFTDEDFNITTDNSGKKIYKLKSGIAKTNYLSNPMPGDIKYIDLNNDGVIDDFDYIKDIVNPTIPELIYGFGINAEWKGAYVNVFFQGAGNVSLSLNERRDATVPFEWGIEESNARQEIIDSRWTEGNPSQDVFYPRVRLSETVNNGLASRWWFRDASFLRLKNIEAGYNFTSEFLSRINVKAARLYIMGQNVALWDKVKMFDPEIGSSAGGSRYPLPSIWSFGLEVKF